jgi:hypothetical protein
MSGDQKQTVRTNLPHILAQIIIPPSCKDMDKNHPVSPKQMGPASSSAGPELLQNFSINS